VGATLGAALLAWLTLKGRPDDGPVAPATAQAAVVPTPEVAAAPDDPDPTRVVGERRQRTLTAPVAPAPAAEDRHRRRAQGRSERRAPTRGGLPEVFRTPGF
jgi:hypothetical protein